MSSQSSTPTSDGELRVALRTEARRLYVDSSYASRGHLEEGVRWTNWDTRLGLPATLASTLLAAGAGVSALVEANKWVAAGLAGAAALAGAAREFFHPAEKAESHAAKGNQYLSIRSEARFFHDIDIRSQEPLDQLQHRLRELRARYNALNESAPLLYSPGSYAKAQEGIRAGESSYEDDPAWKELEG